MNQPSHGYVKIAMIPLLLGTLYWVFPGKTAAPVLIASDPTNSTSAISLAKSEQDQDSNDNELAKKTRWPEFPSNKLENVNPFDRRMIFPEPLAKATTTDPNDSEKHLLVGSNRPLSECSLASLQVQAVFQSPQGIAALIGERIIRIGDRLKDGAQVIGITPHEITVEPPTTH